MNRDEIIATLKTATQDVLDFSGDYNVAGKWNYEEQLVHLTKSIKPLSSGLMLPTFVFRWKFGTPNRPVRTFEEVVEKYLTKLPNLEGANPDYAPKKEVPVPREEAAAQYQKESERLYRAITTWSEAQLDDYLVPHPLLGKVLVREMLYFTIYHTQHHLEILNSIPTPSPST